RLVGIAASAHRLTRLRRGFRHFLVKRLGIVALVRPVVPYRLERQTALHRRPGILGDDRDAFLRRELRRRRGTVDLDHLLDAGDLHRGGFVVRYRLAAIDRRAVDHGELHARQNDVLAVACLADRDIEQIDGRDRALADIAELRLGLELDRTGRRRWHRGGIRRQLAVAELLARGFVDHLVIHRLDLAYRHAPSLGGGGGEHGAAGGAALAHRLDEMPGAARAVLVLVAVLHCVAGRLDYADALPIRLELVGDHERQRGAASRAHLRAVADDRDDAVGRDRDEDMRIAYRAVRHRARARFIGEGRVRQVAHRQNQSARRG